MKIVNKLYLDTIMRPLAGIGDSPEESEVYINEYANDKESYKRLINKEIKPYYVDVLGENTKKGVKLALKYYLTTNKCDFERLFRSLLPPIEPTENPRDFYLWIWEELFGNEDFLLKDAYLYKVIEDDKIYYKT